MHAYILVYLFKFNSLFSSLILCNDSPTDVKKNSETQNGLTNPVYQMRIHGNEFVHSCIQFFVREIEYCCLFYFSYYKYYDMSTTTRASASHRIAIEKKIHESTLCSLFHTRKYFKRKWTQTQSRSPKKPRPNLPEYEIGDICASVNWR